MKSWYCNPGTISFCRLMFATAWNGRIPMWIRSGWPFTSWRKTRRSTRSAGQSDAQDFLGAEKLVPFQLQAWRADARAAHVDGRLAQLDELHEFRHHIHSQQRQEPGIQLERRRIHA